MNCPSPCPALLALAALAVGLIGAASTVAAAGPKPVIYDSDIGDDIDDTWALVTLLKSPELDLRLVVGDQGKSVYRAKLFAKMLEVAGRTDVPVGLGVGNKKGGGRQSEWVKNYSLDDYPGTVHEDGVGAMIKTIMESDAPVTVIAVGPTPNLKAALEREPKIATKARFIGMHGSIYKGYGGKSKPDAEYNVRACPKGLQAIFAAPWPKTITPLDTCGLVHLRGEKYAKIRDAKDPVLKALITNYRHWCGKNPERADKASSTLFDTVAIYLAATDADLCKMETLPLRVTDKGMTVIDKEKGHKVKAAVDWTDLGKYEDWLVQRLLRPVVKP
ncbi:MAG: nucleoside hydrolase [Pirellulales bacterium]